MERRNFKTKRILITTLICVIFVVSIIIGLLLFNEHDVIEDRLINDNEPINETIDDINKVVDNIEDLSQDETNEEDKPIEEKYSVIFLDSDGNILQSSYFTKGTTPYYSGKSLSSKSRKFNTWIPSITTVNGNQAYIATYYYSESSTSSNNNPSSSGGGSTPSVNNTYASIIYNDIEGNQQSLILESGTIINFSAGEHGVYDSVPSPITLTDNQQLDITDSSYNPSSVEVNYIFKGFSYSGNTLKCEYSFVNNTVNVECKQVENTIIKNNTIYIKHDYIESTGTQYIDTGITAKNNTSFEIDMQIQSPYNGHSYVDGGDTSINKRFHFATLGSNLHFGIGSTYTTSPAADTERHIYKLSAVDGKAYRDATLIKTFSTTTYNTNPTFKINSAYNVGYFGYAKYYGYKHYEGSEMKLNLIPAERVIDGEVGLLNILEDGTFFQNKGSGHFKQSGNKIFPGINAGRIMASGSYEAGSSIELKAVANTDYIFVGWSDNTLSATRTITIGDDTVYTALFEHN